MIKFSASLSEPIKAPGHWFGINSSNYHHSFWNHYISMKLKLTSLDFLDSCFFSNKWNWHVVGAIPPWAFFPKILQHKSLTHWNNFTLTHCSWSAALASLDNLLEIRMTWLHSKTSKSKTGISSPASCVFNLAGCFLMIFWFRWYWVTLITNLQLNDHF